MLLIYYRSWGKLELIAAEFGREMEYIMDRSTIYPKVNWDKPECQQETHKGMERTYKRHTKRPPVDLGIEPGTCEATVLTNTTILAHTLQITEQKMSVNIL